MYITQMGMSQYASPSCVKAQGRPCGSAASQFQQYAAMAPFTTLLCMGPCTTASRLVEHQTNTHAAGLSKICDRIRQSTGALLGNALCVPWRMHERVY